MGGKGRSELVVGTLEYGLKAVRESTGLVLDLPQWSTGEMAGLE